MINALQKHASEKRSKYTLNFSLRITETDFNWAYSKTKICHTTALTFTNKLLNSPQRNLCTNDLNNSPNIQKKKKK